MRTNKKVRIIRHNVDSATMLNIFDVMLRNFGLELEVYETEDEFHAIEIVKIKGK